MTSDGFDKLFEELPFLSQREIARRIGMSHTTFQNKLKRGFSFDEAIRVKRALLDIAEPLAAFTMPEGRIRRSRRA